jgi:hypothetical protein
MAIRTDFTAGEVLAAADLNDTFAAKLNLAGGKILNTASTTKNDMFTSTTGSFVDVTGLSVSITPSSATSKILVLAVVSLSQETNNGDAVLRLLRQSTEIGSGTGGSTLNGFALTGGAGSGDKAFSSCINFLDAPNSTSSVNYKIQMHVTLGTGAVNRRQSNTGFGLSSHITVMEVSA